MGQEMKHEETIIQGIPVSPGIAIAPIHVTARGLSAPEVYEVAEDQLANEHQRFNDAILRAKNDLGEIQTRLAELSSEEESQIFEAHIMVLEDQALLKRVHLAIDDRKLNAEYAFYAVMQNFLEAMRRIPDPYLRERTADLEDVCERVLHCFGHQQIRKSVRPDDRHILIAYDLNPSDTATMDRNLVLGFATEMGSVNSHTAIIARSLGIPAVVGLEEAVIDINSLTHAILDGYTGKLILYPTESTLTSYRIIQQKKLKARTALDSIRDEASTTRDGRAITLSANIGLIEELPSVKNSGAAGIGLYRTEFFLLNEEQTDIPNEAEQTAIYTQITRAVAPHPVIIRTLDSGGDKLPAEPLSEPEPNPFLGWRGIRVSLDRPEIFKPQLRAALRASAHGKVALMFPLISGLGEVMQAKKILHQCMEELSREGVPFDANVPVGAMIEIPSAALLADVLAKEVDFFSIGTNDLIQYTLAVDRVNPYVAELYRPTQPAVIRLIHRTIQAGAQAGIWTGMCGEMAGDILLTPLLIGLGIDELSVGPQQVASVRKAIRSLSHAECAAMADDALKASYSADILQMSSTLAKKYYADLFE
ncbi:MAG: phosphoenolpyruvate--protein phosphotransferase [Verrucomicrobiota bacterium]|jgi:phosphotransferase system enzyme I (PtsI)